MGFTGLMADPKGYLNLHRAIIQDSPASATASIPQGAHALPNGKHYEQFIQDPNTFIGLIHSVGWGQRTTSTFLAKVQAKVGMGRIFRSFQPFASPADVGFRYLPFRANNVTYMELDANARFWVTGPLTGCTIGVARHLGNVWTFHSNDNVLTGMGARQVQRQSIQQLCAIVGVPYASVHLCRYTHEYNGFGFVFGRQRANSWKFYSHATDENENTRTVKWAEI